MKTLTEIKNKVINKAKTVIFNFALKRNLELRSRSSLDKWNLSTWKCKIVKWLTGTYPPVPTPTLYKKIEFWRRVMKKLYPQRFARITKDGQVILGIIKKDGVINRMMAEPRNKQVVDNESIKAQIGLKNKFSSVAPSFPSKVSLDADDKPK